MERQLFILNSAIGSVRYAAMLLQDIAPVGNNLSGMTGKIADKLYDLVEEILAIRREVKKGNV